MPERERRFNVVKDDPAAAGRKGGFARGEAIRRRKAEVQDALFETLVEKEQHVLERLFANIDSEDVRGSNQAIQTFFDRLYGKAVQYTEVAQATGSDVEGARERLKRLLDERAAREAGGGPEDAA